jgi:ribonuclease E
LSKIMLVNVTHVEESRVAVVEDGVLSAYEIETTNTTSLKGNIHNAVVESVHATLEAAFVKIAPDRNGFLPLDEVNFNLLPTRGNGRKAGGKIGQHLHPGQKILAQVVREPFAGKPPSVSTYFSLPGRYLVLMPGVDSSGVSRKIEDAGQRERLRKTMEEIKPPEGFGVIVRTAGLGQTKAELQRDLRYLLRLWASIQRASDTTEFPAQVYREADLVIRTIRDHFTPDIAEVWIDNPETHARALEFVRDVMPNRAKSLRLYTGDRPLFNKYNLEEQIERIYKRKVPLPSGGEIVIDGTEALTAIDVNSARSRKQGDIEEMLLQTNSEAAEEIARQLRLRDVGGLIVIDFIDMGSTRNKKKVEKAMRDALRGDRARSELTSISKFGLMEIARQRIRGAKMAASYATCTVCDGHGLIKNVEAAALAALRKMQTRGGRGDYGRVRVILPTEVATWLSNHKREELLRLEKQRRITVDVVPRAEMLRHESEFEFIAREKGQDPPPADPRQEQRAGGQEGERGGRRQKGDSEQRGGAEREPARGEREETRPAMETSSERTASRPRTEAPPDDDPSQDRDRPAASGEGKAGADEAPSGRKRRRRRRRRPRGGGGSSGEAAASAAEDVSESAAKDAGDTSHDAQPDAVSVPDGVRSDELMPAASGGAGGKRKSGGGSRRRRRGSRGGRSSSGRSE